MCDCKCGEGKCKEPAITAHRAIDDLGRIVIPKTIRDMMGIHANESLKIEVVEDTIYISKP